MKWKNQGCYLVCHNEPLCCSFLEEVIWIWNDSRGGAPVGMCPLGPALCLQQWPSFCMCQCPSSVWMCSHFLCTIWDIVASSHGRVGNETGQMNEQCFQGKVTSGCLLYYMSQYGTVMLWHQLPSISCLCLCWVNVCKIELGTWWWKSSLTCIVYTDDTSLPPKLLLVWKIHPHHVPFLHLTVWQN